MNLERATPDLPVDERIARLEAASSAYDRALWDVCARPEEAVASLAGAIRDKWSFAPVRALEELFPMHATDEAIDRLLDWLPVQCPLYPAVLQALLRAGNRALPLIRRRLAGWAAERDDEAVRNALDLVSRMPLSARLQVLPDWFLLLESDDPMIRWSALFQGRELVLVSTLAAPASAPFPVVIERIRELAHGDPHPDVREEAEGCLAAFAVPLNGVRPAALAHPD